MYKCECGRQFEKQNSLNTHARFCKSYIRKNKISKYRENENLYKCECGRIFNNSQGLNGHFCYCLIHRNGKPPMEIKVNWGNSGNQNKPWCKGLNKENNLSLLNASNSLKENYSGKDAIWYGKHHSDETKRILSEKRMKFLQDNPNSNIKWFSISNGEKEIKVQGKWELNIANWLNEINEKWDRITIKYKNRRYTPDFYLIDRDEYIEVKGWLKDRDLYKMFLVLQENPDIKIRLLQKKLYKKIDKIKIEDIPIFNEIYSLDNVDFNKFKNVFNLLP
jgi:hypothetical protein